MDLSVFFIIGIIAILLFYLFEKLFKSKISNNFKRRVFGITTALVLAPLLYFLLFMAEIYFVTKEKHRDFNSNEWNLNNRIEQKLSKYEMIDDLIDKELLIGKDSLKVKKIIGEPNFRTKNKWRYDAGTGGGFGFVDHFLEITYNNQGEVFFVEHKRIND